MIADHRRGEGGDPPLWPRLLAPALYVLGFAELLAVAQGNTTGEILMQSAVIAGMLAAFPAVTEFWRRGHVSKIPVLRWAGRGALFFLLFAALGFSDRQSPLDRYGAVGWLKHRVDSASPAFLLIAIAALLIAKWVLAARRRRSVQPPATARTNPALTAAFWVAMLIFAGYLYIGASRATGHPPPATAHSLWYWTSSIYGLALIAAAVAVMVLAGRVPAG